MAGVYVDTAYHIAVIDPLDSYRDAALSVGDVLQERRTPFITSEAALIELLTFLSGRTPRIRRAAAAYVRALYADPLVEVVPQSQTLFDAALDLYERRPDKSYSMVDCIGMVICREREITDVLTADHDFEQEDLTILLN